MAVPNTITTLVVSANRIGANVSWTEPSSDSAILRNEISFQLSSGGRWATFVDTNLGPFPSITVSNLNIVAYNFRVRAVSSEGNAVWSSVVMNITPLDFNQSLELELNEEGLVDNPVGVNNTGLGFNRDFLNQVGSGSALTIGSHKNKRHWESTGQRALQSGGSQVRISQPTTLFWVGIPTGALNSSDYKVIWASPAGSPDSSARTDGTTLFAGGAAINGLAMDVNSDEYIIVYKLNGSGSSIRVIKNDGSTDNTVFGSPGSDNPSVHILGVDPSLTAARFFNAKYMELDWYLGDMAGSHETAKIESLKQKWFLGVDSTLPSPELLYDETSVSATGWTNVGLLAGSNDFDTVSGIGGNLSITTVAGLSALNSVGNVKLTSSNPTAINAPYTVYAVVKCSSITATIKYLFSSGVSFNISTLGHIANAGSSLANGVSGSTDLVVIAIVVDGSDSVIQCKGGVVFNNSGNVGTNDFSAASILWNMSSTAGQSFEGDFCELRIYAAAHEPIARGQILDILLTKWTALPAPPEPDTGVHDNTRLGINIGISV